AGVRARLAAHAEEIVAGEERDLLVLRELLQQEAGARVGRQRGIAPGVIAAAACGVGPAGARQQQEGEHDRRERRRNLRTGPPPVRHESEREVQSSESELAVFPTPCTTHAKLSPACGPAFNPVPSENRRAEE